MENKRLQEFAFWVGIVGSIASTLGLLTLLPLAKELRRDVARAPGPFQSYGGRPLFAEPKAARRRALAGLQKPRRKKQ